MKERYAEFQRIARSGKKAFLSDQCKETEENNRMGKMGFPGGSDGKVSAYNVGDLGSIPGSGRSPGEGNGTLASKIPWTEEPDSPWGRQESDTTENFIFTFNFTFRDLFKKIRDTMGTFHAKMGSIKDRNGMDLTEADIKKRWQEYTEELNKKDLHDPGNQDGVITHLEPDILECEVKWALESITEQS